MPWLSAIYTNHLLTAAERRPGRPLPSPPASLRAIFPRRATMDDRVEAGPVLRWLEALVDATARELPMLASIDQVEHDSPLFHLSSACETSGDGLNNLLTYGRLLTDLYTFSVRSDGDRIRLMMHVEADAGCARGLQFLMEYELCAKWTAVQLTYPEFPPFLAVAMPAEDAPVDTYSRFFGCPLISGAPHAEVSCHKGALRARARSPNPVLRRYLQRELDERLAALSPAEPERIEKRLAAHLRTALPRDTTAADCARALGLSERTLIRRLTDEGTTFRRVLDGVRYQLARRFLTDRSPEQVADALGYADATSFRRAFRRWQQ